MIHRMNAAVVIAIPVAVLAVMLGLVIVGGDDQALGSFTSSLEGRSAGQLQNIGRAARAVDGTVVRPGEVFSFNRTVGERSSNRGYLLAPAIVEGRLEESEGGGICQLSSTLYNAALLAGMEIEERHPHTYPVASVPPGRDAAVVFGGNDMRFRNIYARPVTIRADASGARLVVRITGGIVRESDFRIELETGRSLRPVNATRGASGTEYITATVWREELRGGEIVGREFISSDTYIKETPRR